MTDANGNKASMTYDDYDRQVQWNFPDKTTVGAVSAIDYEAYTYDANGNRLSLRKRDGCIINFTYDALNRMTVKDLPSGVIGGVNCGSAPDVYYGYDLRGLQLYARFGSDSGAGITNTFDGFGRQTTTSNNMSGTPKTLSFQWDADGNRTRITHASGAYFTYDHDKLDRLTTIKESGTTTLVTDVYDAQGRRVTEARGPVTTIVGGLVGAVGGAVVEGVREYVVDGHLDATQIGKAALSNGISGAIVGTMCVPNPALAGALDGAISNAASDIMDGRMPTVARMTEGAIGGAVGGRIADHAASQVLGSARHSAMSPNAGGRIFVDAEGRAATAKATGAREHGIRTGGRIGGSTLGGEISSQVSRTLGSLYDGAVARYNQAKATVSQAWSSFKRYWGF